MPYKITKDTQACPAPKPYAVRKEDQPDSKPLGCHPTQPDAQKQIAALEAQENGPAMDNLIRNRARR